MAGNVQDVIMCLGDSLTQKGWSEGGLIQRLAEAYVRKLDVLNRGFGGYQTDWAIQVLEQIFAKQHEQHHAPKVQLLTIWYGANDAAVDGDSQHVPVNRFKSNLKQMIDMIRSPASSWYSPDTRIVLITPPPVNTDMWNNHTRDFDRTREYAEAVKEVAQETQLPVLDTWTTLYDAAGRTMGGCSKFLTDGLHLNSAGYEIIYGLLTNAIAEHYPEIHYDKLQNVFIPWDQVLSGDPRITLQKRNALVNR